MSETTAKTTQKIWEQALEKIRQTVSQNDFSTWFSRISLKEEKDGNTVFTVPSIFIKDRIVSQYKDMIEKTLAEYGKKTTAVFQVKKQDLSGKLVQTIPVPEKPHETVKTVSAEYKNPTLNPAYTFESFVPGDNCQLAYSACLAISKNPGATYNPCLLYGGVGLGKTHLLQSIGNAICAENPKAKVMYVTAENFLNDLIKAIADNTTHQFRNKYRKVSVLLMDDIQLLQGKTRAQEELFNTFNDLYDSGKQLVFTCDRPIEDLKDVADRLTSRFIKGLPIDIQPPVYETRVAIIQSKCRLQNFELGREIIEFIAENVSSNVRVLESCITKLKAYSELLHQDISMETAREQLKQIIFANNDTSGIKMDDILKAVADYFGVSVFDLKGKSRSKSIILPRQIAVYICSKLTDNSTTQIAREFEQKEHTTVMYTVRKVEALMNSSEKSISNTVNKIIGQIKSNTKK